MNLPTKYLLAIALTVASATASAAPPTVIPNGPTYVIQNYGGWKGVNAVSSFSQTGYNGTIIITKGTIDYAFKPPKMTVTKYNGQGVKPSDVVSVETGRLPKTVTDTTFANRLFIGQTTVKFTDGSTENINYQTVNGTYQKTITYPPTSPDHDKTVIIKMTQYGVPVSRTTVNKINTDIHSATTYKNPPHGPPLPNVTTSYLGKNLTHKTVYAYDGNGDTTTGSITYYNADGKTPNGKTTLQTYTKGQVSSQVSKQNGQEISSETFPSTTSGQHTSGKIIEYTNGKPNGKYKQVVYSNGLATSYTEYQGTGKNKITLSKGTYTYATNDPTGLNPVVSITKTYPNGNANGSNITQHYANNQITSQVSSTQDKTTSSKGYANGVETSITDYKAGIKTDVYSVNPKGQYTSKTEYGSAGKIKTSEATYTLLPGGQIQASTVTVYNADGSVNAAKGYSTTRKYNPSGSYTEIKTFTATGSQQTNNYTVKGVLIAPVVAVVTHNTKAPVVTKTPVATKTPITPVGDHTISVSKTPPKPTPNNDAFSTQGLDTTQSSGGTGFSTGDSSGSSFN